MADVPVESIANGLEYGGQCLFPGLRRGERRRRRPVHRQPGALGLDRGPRLLQLFGLLDGRPLMHFEQLLERGDASAQLGLGLDCSIRVAHA